MSEEFRLRSVAVAAYGPATLFGLAEGSMLPVITLSAIDRGASTAVAALVGALLGIGSILTNIPSGVLATRIGERKSMIVAAVATVAGLALCLANLGRGAGSLLVYGSGVLLIGSASSVYGLARQSYLTEMVPPHMRARALSTLGGTLRIGVFIGPFLGAGAMQLWGLPGAYYVSLVAITVAGVIVYRVPDLEVSDEHKAAAAQVTTWSVLKQYRRTFLTLGAGVLLLSAIRQTRQVVIPLWAAHIGLSPTANSVIYGVAGGVDALTFYPAGKVMDVYGRRWVAVPCVIIMGVSFVLMPLTHAAVTLACTAMIMGFGNGIGSGIVMTLAADVSPAIGRPTFLGIWRELADAGAGAGPLALSAVTALAGLGPGIIVSGLVGFAAAAALWTWTPKRGLRWQKGLPSRELAGGGDEGGTRTGPAGQCGPAVGGTVPPTVAARLDALQRRLGEALFARVAGPQGDANRARFAAPGPRWFDADRPIRQVHGDAAMFIGGLRALLLQSLHPQAMTAVAQHSDYRNDPWGRLQRTSTFLAATTYGTADDAQRAVDRVRRVHQHVTGTGPGGVPYQADDPHLLRWVHVAEADSFLRCYQRYGARPLDAAGCDGYVADAARIALALGVPDPPRTRQELDAALDAYRPELRAIPQAREAARFLVWNPPLPLLARGPYALLAATAVAELPGWARRELRLPRPRAAEAVLVPAAGRGVVGAIRWAMAPRRQARADAA